jgi:hypothetical protein
VEIRYPEALYGEIPIEEAEKALQIAKNVKEFILNKIETII